MNEQTVFSRKSRLGCFYLCKYFGHFKDHLNELDWYSIRELSGHMKALAGESVDTLGVIRGECQLPYDRETVQRVDDVMLWVGKLAARVDNYLIKLPKNRTVQFQYPKPNECIEAIDKIITLQNQIQAIVGKPQ